MATLPERITRVEQENAQLRRDIASLTKQIEALAKRQRDDSIFDSDFGGRKIIRREVQFMGNVYRRSGTKVTQINP